MAPYPEAEGHPHRNFYSESLHNSSTSSINNEEFSRPSFMNPGGTGGDGSTSLSSSMREEQLMDQEELYYYKTICHGNIDEYKKARKKVQNKESALRSRMKKKHYYDHLESDLNATKQEGNKLKLENAALRAENQLLKRQVGYFENLFAKRTQSTNSQSSVHS